MARKKNVTFDDIAKYTNFSKTTISRYFNDIDSLTLENQQIISDALVALNYQENRVCGDYHSGFVLSLLFGNVGPHPGHL